MMNIFLLILWPIIIVLTVFVYRRVKKMYRKTTAVIVAGLAFVISVFVVSNIFAYWYSARLYDIRNFFSYPIYLIAPTIVQ
jgi:hypothetical protein